MGAGEGSEAVVGGGETCNFRLTSAPSTTRAG